jgi:hypothetical protein
LSVEGAPATLEGIIEVEDERSSRRVTMRDIPLDAGAWEQVAAAYELGGDTEAAEAFTTELAEAYGIPARSYRVTITEYSELLIG